MTLPFAGLRSDTFITFKLGIFTTHKKQRWVSYSPVSEARRELANLTDYIYFIIADFSSEG